ncbi:hypothetical protein [Endozoicomonas sp. 8E]|uniref:hypothetical protein n=1 Tax=Endozoicomonas sp. 8E TaxID=3035692 RepID=UPI0029393F53|nr:hypothetical protein [Endozoicomonas sp. 8E]WOG26939.1 hypothetical protein P6910_20675 [Endozoicomonas sp. 8E]
MGAAAADTVTPAGQATCNLITFCRCGQLMQCGRIFKNKKTLLSHKSNYHAGRRTCNVTMVGEDGLQRPCIVVRKDDLPRPCAKAYSNTKALSTHKSGHHTG